MDVETRRPVLANVLGGLSGPAIRPIALRMVWQASRAVSLPICGIGGIASIVRMDLVTMTRQYAQVDIGFIGDEERLSRALSQSDLALSRSALAGWELRLAGATGGAAVPLGAVVPLSDQGAQPQSEVQSESLSGAEGDGLQEAPAESLSTVE